MSEMRRDMTARLFNPESFGGESFISEEVAINILQETKLAFQRSNLVCLPSRRDMTARLFNPESFGGESFISEEVAINILQETKLAFQRSNLVCLPSRRDMTARLFNPESFGGESFISEEVAINILQETKLAFQRSNLLSAPGDEANNTEEILNVLLRYLFAEHLEYAVELAFNNLPLGELKSEPGLGFLTVVRQTAAICHLFEKQFEDSIIPLLKSSIVREKVRGRKAEVVGRVEGRLSGGLERLLSALVAYARTLLSDQKKTDFRPENEEALIPLCSTVPSPFAREQLHPLEFQTSKRVGTFLSEAAAHISEAVDGDNARAVLTELGVRFHRALVDHLYTFTFSSTGGMVLLCDINEYRRALSLVIKASTLVGRLFEALHALSNLLVVVPENLHDATSAELLGDVDRSIIVNFVQLRADYKNAKLFNEFR